MNKQEKIRRKNEKKNAKRKAKLKAKACKMNATINTSYIRCKDVEEGLIRANSVYKRAKAENKSYDEVLNEMNCLVIGTNENDMRLREADKKSVHEITDTLTFIFKNQCPAIVKSKNAADGMSNEIYICILDSKVKDCILKESDSIACYEQTWKLNTPVSIYHVHHMMQCLYGKAS